MNCLIVAGAVIFGCANTNHVSDHVYTLYRTSLVPGVDRVHVASFDTGEGELYNRDNCFQAQELFQKQPAIQTKFWCEKGRHRK